jgi:YidC/Oxa1 family membrane protein insertase
MDRSTLLKYAGLALAIVLFLQFGLPKITGSDGKKDLQPFPPDVLQSADEPSKRPRDGKGKVIEKFCEFAGKRFHATATTQSASLKHFKLDGEKYSINGKPGSPPIDMVTTPDIEGRQPLFTHFRAVEGKANDQIKYDFFDWKLESQTPSSCVFTYQDDDVSLKKVISATDRDFEVAAEITVINRKKAPAKHHVAVETAAWRTDKEVAGSLGRQSPYLTQVEIITGKKHEEKTPSDFKPKDFKDKEFRNGWYTIPTPNFVATTNSFFAQALVPAQGPGEVTGQTLIEYRWHVDEFSSKSDDPGAGAFYRSRLLWPEQTLAPEGKAEYKVFHYLGPKERSVLATAGGNNADLSKLINLGFFSIIAKVLTTYLLMLQNAVKSWGLAIIVLTVTVRTLLFPITWKQIRSQAKMRQLQPELNEINKKFANDTQQKQLATMELYRKYSINPISGCLPALVQLPVWFALYTTIQKSTELFHTPFLWFRDLAAPDTIHIGSMDIPFILPILLGATTFLQQKIMPAQMDATQQKMMTYLIPGVITVMMLFLPTGLGVYMFTNSLLGIVQQLAVERYLSKQAPGKPEITVRENDNDKNDSSDGSDGGSTSRSDEKKSALPLALGKGKARV